MQFESDVFIKDGSHEWETIDSGVKRKILGFNDDLMIVRIAFDKGAVGAIHKHPHSQTSYVEKGAFEVTIGDRKQLLRQGDSFYVPPGTAHGVAATEEGILIDAFNPVREDFLRK